MTKKLIISTISLLFLSIITTGCANKQQPVNSSYQDNNAMWQQFKSDKAVENIDK